MLWFDGQLLAKPIYCHYFLYVSHNRQIVVFLLLPLWTWVFCICLIKSKISVGVFLVKARYVGRQLMLRYQYVPHTEYIISQFCRSITYICIGFLSDKENENMYQVELKVPNVNFHSFMSISDWPYTYVTPFYSHYTFLHVSALKGPSSRSTDIFCEQCEQNARYILHSSCQTST
jgi:hypothetical protein